MKLNNVYPINFHNNNSEGTLEQEGLRHLLSRREDIQTYIDAMNDDVDIWEVSPDGDLPEWPNYGLAFDYCEDEDYYRYQISWGGPSEEIRFKRYGDIEFVFLDWFCGIGFDVTNDVAFDWVKCHLEEVGCIDWDRDQPSDEYYASLEEEIDEN